MTQETFSPVAQACIRIYRKQQNILVFEDFLLSDAYGMTSWIPLYVDGKNPVEYLVDIRIGNYRNLQQKVILYANERSCLLTLMRTNTQKGNTHQVTKDCLCFAHDPPVSCFPAGVFQPVISKLMHLLSEKMNPTSSDEQLEAAIMKLLSLQEQDSTTDEGGKAATATYCFYPDLLAKAVHYFNAYSNQKNPIDYSFNNNTISYPAFTRHCLSSLSRMVNGTMTAWKHFLPSTGIGIFLAWII